METVASLNKLFVDLEKEVEKVVDGLQMAVANHLAQEPAEPVQPAMSGGQRFGRDSRFTGFVGEHPQGGQPTAATPSPEPNHNAQSVKKLPKSQMPWWRGLRGLWRWALYGNSPDNPDYAHYESVRAKLTLSEYVEYRSKLDEFADEVIGHLQLERSEALEPAFAQFKQLLSQVIAQYRNRAVQLLTPQAAPTSSDPGDGQPQDPRELLHAPDDTHGHVDDTSDDDIEQMMNQPAAPEAPVEPEAQADAPQSTAAIDHRKQAIERVAEKVANKEVDDPQSNWFTPGGGVARHALPSIMAWLINKARKDDGEVGVNIFDKREVNNALARHGFNGKADLTGRFFNYLGIKKNSEEAESILQSLGWKHGVKSRPSAKGVSPMQLGDDGRPTIAKTQDDVEPAEIQGQSLEDLEDFMANNPGGEDDAAELLRGIGVPDDIINAAKAGAAEKKEAQPEEAPAKAQPATATAEPEEKTDPSAAVNAMNKLMQLNMTRQRNIKQQMAIAQAFENKVEQFKAGKLKPDQLAAHVAKVSQRIADDGGFPEKYPSKMSELMKYVNTLDIPQDDDDQNEHAVLLRNEHFIRKIKTKRIPAAELKEFYREELRRVIS